MIVRGTACEQILVKNLNDCRSLGVIWQLNKPALSARAEAFSDFEKAYRPVSLRNASKCYLITRPVTTVTGPANDFQHVSTTLVPQLVKLMVHRPM